MKKKKKKKKSKIVNLINVLIDDQYGNYVLQHVMLTGDQEFALRIVSKVRNQFYFLSTKKFASNVVEKMFEIAAPHDRTLVVKELLERKANDGHSELFSLMKDQYANYVAQKIIDLSDETTQRTIVEHIKPHLHLLRRYTYGKHIISRVEKLSNHRNRR
eukprot:TRINITY_DN5691_c1_g1_i5.p1 TRINITY_DN5691_c1_g1~~TRINITY_DN5691_c1_g1_i5.p1  ORF type:complete len:159 (+),score=22.70 TRINITY_DN5691_c1_g1_i5:54-530(+)